MKIIYFPKAGSSCFCEQNSCRNFTTENSTKKVKKNLKDQWNKGWSQNLIMIGTLIQQAKAKSVRAVHIYNTAYMILAISFSLHKVP